MIELVFEERCSGCGRCNEICPTDVFDVGENGVPIIARQEECDSCFLCEAHCPTDALYVWPKRYPADLLDRAAILASGILGNYRRALGFDQHEPGTYAYEGPVAENKAPRFPPNPADPNTKIYEALAEVERRSLVTPSS